MLKPVPCATDGAKLWVGVTVTSRGHWEASGVWLEGRADGRDYRTEWDFSMQVCAVGDDPADECQGRPATPVVDFPTK